jgi:uncharacterized membrane protein YeaQ/YmgE (transglycosylase-associated protein family)
MILVFSKNANNSNDIKNEVALASQYQLVVIPVRVEDVVPNDALAYALATKQWIDLFRDWKRAIDRLGDRVAAILSVDQTSKMSEAIVEKPPTFKPTPSERPPPATPTAAPIPPAAPAFEGAPKKGRGLGLVGNIAIGIIGAFIGSWLLPRLGISIVGGIIAAVINAIIGATIALLIAGTIRR